MTDPTAETRKTAYLLMGAVAVFICVAKIVGVENTQEPHRYLPTQGQYGWDAHEKDPKYITRLWPEKRPEPTPTFGSNDRSRWATVRALVENGTYAVGQRGDMTATDPKQTKDTGIIFLPDSQSVDKVMNPETGQFYSSKPPLFPTMVAGEYWLITKLFGWRIGPDRWLVIPFILLTINALPLVLYFFWLAKLIDFHGKTDFGRLTAFATACFGTYLITFSPTLNNHTPATIACLFALYPLLRPRASGEIETPIDLFLAGLFAAFTATFDLPAACFTAGLCLPLFVARPKAAVMFMLPGMLIPVAAFFACNYAALGRLTPAYSEFGGPWYEYVGSNWTKLRDARNGIFVPGIDYAQDSRGVYLFHCLLGHHGWFSLTPMWLAGLVGMAVSVMPAIRDLKILKRSGPVWTLPLIIGLCFACTLTLTVFYVFVQKTNNFGGMTSVLRWFMWLTPLWLLATVSGADVLSRLRWSRIVVAGLLGFSVMSVFYPVFNPWRHPWIMALCEFTGWVKYGNL
jgi:hypothetical protein